MDGHKCFTIKKTNMHNPMLRFILFAAMVMAFHHAKADCLACWEQRKVEIILSTGDTLTGYVAWNEAWLEDTPGGEQWKNKFPESLVAFYRNIPNHKDLMLIQKLIPVKNDSIDLFFATQKEFIKFVDLKQVKSIRELEVDTVKYQGAGKIPVFTQTEFDRLKTNPVAILEIEEPVSDTFLLSYSPLVTKEVLNSIHNSRIDKNTDEMKQKGIIVYTIAYD
jgi:hypothetical protein